MDLQLFAERTKFIQPSFIREILKVAANPEITSFAGGLPNPSFFPVKQLGKCSAEVFIKKGRTALQYAETEGYFPLREYIAARYRKLYQLDVSPSQILITNGSQQALDLVAKLFIDPGDGIVLERPSYLGAIQAFSMYQPSFKDVTLCHDGIDTLELADALDKQKFKLFYTIPNFQNPTGIQYSIEKRKETAALISETNTFIVEDDPYGELRFDKKLLPPIYSFLPHQTILSGSFSKAIAPGLRLGWILADEHLIKKLAVLKQASDLHSGNLAQFILYEYLISYDIEIYLKEIRAAYQKQRDIMLDCLDHYFPFSATYARPQGGLFAWVTLPAGITARELLEKALKKNIIFVPGDTFYVSDPDPQTLRLNFSNVEEGPMRKAMKTLGELLG